MMTPSDLLLQSLWEEEPPGTWTAARLAEMRRLLPRLLIEGDALERYIAYRSESAVRRGLAPVAAFLGTWAVDTPDNEPLPMATVEEILRVGPTAFEAFEADRLAALLRNSVGLRELADQIESTVPAGWQAALLADAAAYAPPRPAPPRPDPSRATTPMPTPVRASGRFRWLIAVGGAASVLLNLAFVGYEALRDDRDPGVVRGKDSRTREGTNVYASIDPGIAPRNVEAARSLFVDSDRPGFVTLVLLRPRERPEFVPSLGTDQIRVGISGAKPIEWPLNAEDLVPDAAAIVVVTRQPVSAFLRSSLKLPPYRPENLESVRGSIETVLVEYNFEALWIRIVPMPK